jgi:micrococcal nuclease
MQYRVINKNKKCLFSLFLLIGWVISVESGSCGTVHRDVTGVAEFVIDGDTIRVSGLGSVRYIGINAPELGTDRHRAEYLAEAARQFNRSLVEGKLLRIEFDRVKRDRFGRLLAYVWIQTKGRCVNQELLENGYAYCYPYENRKYSERFLSAQQKAMRQEKGIWKILARRNAMAAGVVASRRSMRFHHPSCPYGSRIHSRNRIVFRSIRDAFWNGYAPCRKCLGRILRE